MSNQRITALLVVHDGATWLPEVVASIASQSRSADQILAIDTGSIDASAKLLKGARIPTVTLDRTTSFGDALRYGLSQLPPAIEGVDEWLWILHDDCALDPRALEELELAVIDRPNIVMAGPKLLGWHDRTHLLEVGISIATNGSRWTGLEPNEYDQGQRDGVHEVLSVSTAAALIRRDAFEDLGGFDPNLELFRDDVDFGWRAHAAGFSVLAVTSAIGYHAQAAASERREIDIAGAPLHRPLLLDRRNAAYVLLANSSWWRLPLLTLQLFSGALIRSLGYLFAKLPGYASDEVLAIASLLIHPRELLSARAMRRKQRLVSSGNVLQFIPSRWTQLRSGVSRNLEALRTKLFPDGSEEVLAIPSELELNEDEDILAPVPGNSWKVLFTRPMVLAFTALAVITFGWTRHRLGAISGGALAASPSGSSDLFKFYVESWHHIGMGSNVEAPVWTFIVALASVITFGKPALLITLLFISAPFLALASAYSLLKKFTTSPVLVAGCALLYALSPISISAINSGRLGIIVLLIFAPIFASVFSITDDIHSYSTRKFFALILSLFFIAAFNPQLLIALLGFVIYCIAGDFIWLGKNIKDPRFISRTFKNLALLFTPVLLLAPNSLQYFIHPSRLLLEIGLQDGGSGSNYALLANPGGEGSLPWWSLSPVTLLILVTYFSTTAARKFSAIGAIFLSAAALASSLQISGNGSTTRTPVYAGTFIAIATLMAMIAAVVMFTDLRSRLESAHLNYQHFAVAFLLIVTIAYSATSTIWVFSAGANSPVHHKTAEILPAYLLVEEDAKTLVIRTMVRNNESSLEYFVSRGDAAQLGSADIAGDVSLSLSTAVEGLIDNTGITSSKVLAAFGIKYIFVANPAKQDLIQTIDGLGGFVRASATDVGTVWKVTEPTGQVLFTDFGGKVSALDEVQGSVIAPGTGTITLTEQFSNSWQALENGEELVRTQSSYGLPQFDVKTGGEVLLIHDGTNRRAWISIFLITLISCIVMATPSGRRRSEISEKELA